MNEIRVLSKSCLIEIRQAIERGRKELRYRGMKIYIIGDTVRIFDEKTAEKIQMTLDDERTIRKYFNER